MEVQNMGSGVFVFGSGNLAELTKFPSELASFKKEHPDLLVTAITIRYELFRGELFPRGYVVSVEPRQ